MKSRLKNILFLGMFLLTMPVFSQSPVEYMDKITQETRKIQTDMWDYTSAVAHGKSARKVEKRRSELLKTSQEALERVKAMPAFNGSTAYRDSVINFLEINYMILKVDYAQIIQMEVVAEQSYENMEKYLAALDVAGDKMQNAGDMVSAEQKTFAAANNITLTHEENKLSEKMEIANAVYEHYNTVYLIFFKSFLTESNLISALSARNLEGIKSNREKLKADAKEGLEKLKEISSYNGDNTVVAACQNMLNFYAAEAKKMDIVIDYYEKNKGFEEIQANFEKIKEKNRTQEDVDTYNNAVNDLNAAAESFNKLTEDLNKERADKLDNWNKTIGNFTDKHVPKGKG